MAPLTENKEHHCEVCRKEISKEEYESYDGLCWECWEDQMTEECGTTGLCSTCAELWESEIDLEDLEAEEE